MSKSTMMMYIDSNNFYKNVQALYDGDKLKIKWQQLILDIRNLIQQDYECGFSKAYYYSALSERNDNPIVYDRQKKFLNKLNQCKFIDVIIGKLSRVPRYPNIPIDKSNPSTYIHVEKATDVNVANGMMISTANIIVLFSADTDYENTIRTLQKRGKTLLVVIPVGAKSSHIQSIVGSENVYFLDKEFLDKHVKVPDLV